MKFKLTKANSGADPKTVIINSLDDLKKLQEKLIAEEIEEYNEGNKEEDKVKDRKELILSTCFSYELIVDLIAETIEFRNYWVE